MKTIKNRKVLSILTIFILIFNLIGMTKAHATTNQVASVTTSANVQEIGPSQSFILTVNLDNIRENSQGVFSLAMTLDVQPDVLEEIVKTDITAAEGWTVSAYNASTKRLTMRTNNRSAVKQPGPILTINLRTKPSLSNVTNTTTTTDITQQQPGGMNQPTNLVITLQKIVANNNINISEVSQPIRLTTAGSVIATPQVTIGPNGEVADPTLPQGGLDAVEIRMIIALMAISIISFISIRKLNGKL